MSVSKNGKIRCNHCKKKFDYESDVMTIDMIYPYDPEKISYGKYRRIDICKNCMDDFLKKMDNYLG